MKKESYDVAIIGGGPAGMMAAGRAAEMGAKVILIEKNENLGKKLLISGGGRCNVTNEQYDNRKLLEHYGDARKFLFSTFSQFAVKDALEFFHNRGMETKVENDNRVFPTSDSSRSVLNALLSYMEQGKVSSRTNSAVTKIDASAKTIKSITLNNGEQISAKSFIIATGGKSYPETGSTGDGFAWLAKLGHKIAKPSSALVPLTIADKWLKPLQGVALPDVKIRLIQDSQKILSKRGKILFTHFGVSGPTILNMSAKVGELMSYGDTFISLDILPDHDFSTLNTALTKLFHDNNKKQIQNTLSLLIRAAFVPVVLAMTNIDGEKVCHNVTREERMTIMHTLKDIRMQVSGLLGPENAIVSSGGVSPAEIDWKTMQSKIVDNLYIVGDLLNINRPSGGFSLQLCWTTGYVAGSHATM